MESVIIMISWIFSFSIVGMRLMQMAISSVSIKVTLTAWICTYLITELSDQTGVTTMVIWDFLISPSAMTAVLLWEVWEENKVLLRFWRWENKSLSEKERDEWKLTLLGKWSTILRPGEKRGFKGSKLLWTLLRHSLTFLIGLLRFACCLTVSLDMATLYRG